MRKLLLTILLVTLYFVELDAQTSFGGTPPGFAYPQAMRSAAQTHQLNLTHIDVKELIRQDVIAEANGSPRRIAVGIPVQLDIDKTGEWIELPGGQTIWQQTLSAQGAKGMIISYEEFRIPEGGKLFIYNADKSQVIGAFTEKTNPKGGRFSTQMVYGEEITLEYVKSTLSEQKPRLKIESVGYVYFRDEEEKARFRNYADPGLGESDYCMIDVNCPEGDDWQEQKRGVVLTFTKYLLFDDWYSCSGSLINNTENDGKPYVLSAHHCFFLPYDQDVQFGDLETSQFYFHYENPSCQEEITEMPASTRVLVGSRMLTHEVFATGSDGSLLLLDEEVPVEWQPYFNGWDISTEPAESGVVIHHPLGDVKKISTFSNPASSVAIQGAANENWWQVYYLPTRNGHGSTEGGSSGASLFNQDGLIIGTLTGGMASCSNPYGLDYFGKISEHFKGYHEGGMQAYLDPLNTGVTRLQGYDPAKETGIQQEKTNSGAELVIFPNPAETEININAASIIRNVYVFDMKGQQLRETKGHTSSTLKLDISGWEKGIYSIVVETENGKYSEKIVKQ